MFDRCRMTRPYVFDWMLKLPWKIGRMQKNALTVLRDFTKKVSNVRMHFSIRLNNFLLKISKKINKIMLCYTSKVYYKPKIRVLRITVYLNLQ